MSNSIRLKSKDGFELGAYVAQPEGEPVAGLVVIQEIFGVNRHIRSVADGYAKDGFLVVAPAIFDRIERDLELGYEGDNSKKAFEFMQKTDVGLAIDDIGTAVEYVKSQTGKKAGTVGYCFGGLLSWLSAARLPIDAAVGYYPGGIGNFAAETPQAPVMLHIGKNDSHISGEMIGKVQTLHPEVQVFWYHGAEHAFNNDMRSSYDPEAAGLARSRSIQFLKSKLI